MWLEDDIKNKTDAIEHSVELYTDQPSDTCSVVPDYGPACGWEGAVGAMTRHCVDVSVVDQARDPGSVACRPVCRVCHRLACPAENGAVMPPTLHGHHTLPEWASARLPRAHCAATVQ